MGRGTGTARRFVKKGAGDHSPALAADLSLLGGIPLHCFHNGSIDKGIDTLTLGFGVGLNGVLSALGHSQANPVVGSFHILVDGTLLGF